RLVTAPDVTAGQAEAQVDPLAAHGQALLAALAARLDGVRAVRGRLDVFADFIHGVVPSLPRNMGIRTVGCQPRGAAIPPYSRNDKTAQVRMGSLLPLMGAGGSSRSSKRSSSRSRTESVTRMSTSCARVSPSTCAARLTASPMTVNSISWS